MNACNSRRISAKTSGIQSILGAEAMTRRSILLVALAVAWSVLYISRAQVLENRLLVVDFTKADTVGRHVTWSDAKAITATKQGLGSWS